MRRAKSLPPLFLSPLPRTAVVVRNNGGGSGGRGEESDDFLAQIFPLWGPSGCTLPAGRADRGQANVRNLPQPFLDFQHGQTYKLCQQGEGTEITPHPGDIC